MIILLEAFEKNNYPDATKRKNIARKCKLTEEKVGIWFKNKRTKSKKDNFSSNTISETIDLTESTVSFPQSTVYTETSSEEHPSRSVQSSNNTAKLLYPSNISAINQELYFPQRRMKCQKYNLYGEFGAPACPKTFPPPPPSYESLHDPSSKSQFYSQDQVFNLGTIWSHSPAVTFSTGGTVFELKRLNERKFQF